MIFWFFNGKIIFSCKNTIIIVNDFIVFVKFLSWIVAIWMKLSKLIRRKRPKVLEEDPNIKIKYNVITKKKNGPKESPGPLEPPHLGPFLSLEKDLRPSFFYFFCLNKSTRPS